MAARSAAHPRSATNHQGHHNEHCRIDRSSRSRPALSPGSLSPCHPTNREAGQAVAACTALPLPMVRFIGLAEVLGGLGVLLAPLAGQAWLVPLAASGLALIMLPAGSSRRASRVSGS